MARARYVKDMPAGFKNAVERIAIVGVTGTVGTFITKEFLKTGKHTLTALTRPSSTSKAPEGVKTVEVDYANEESLVAALKDQQVLIISLAVMTPEHVQANLIKAAAKAGVTYVMPNVWGPDVKLKDILTEIYFGAHLKAIDLIETFNGQPSWIVMGTGFWYEYSLGGGDKCFGFNFHNRKVTWIGDENTTKQNTTTWEQTGRGVAAFFSLKWLPEDANDKEAAIDNWANNAFYIDSFNLTQREMFESVKRVTGTTDADWTFSRESAEDRVKNGQAAMQKGDRSGFAKQMYSRFLYPDSPGNHENRSPLQNKLLGLPQEDLDTCTKKAVDMALNDDFGNYTGRGHSK